MAGMMAYTLTEHREEELPVTDAWRMINKRELASMRVCCVMYVMYVRSLAFQRASGAASGCSARSPRHPRSCKRASGRDSRGIQGY